MSLGPELKSLLNCLQGKLSFMKAKKLKITVSAEIYLSVEKTWEFWTSPHHILHWNAAHPSWTTTHAVNDLVRGGRFSFRMEARDGSEGFDFSGAYTEVRQHEIIRILLDDNRLVSIQFDKVGDNTLITESFEPESTNTLELQRFGWQAILDNFKNYAESYKGKELLNFSIIISDSPERVQDTMLADPTYREWTSVFNPASYFRGSWDKGSRIHFIGIDSEGNEAGMVSIIKENIPGKFLSIEHLGTLRSGKEMLDGTDVEAWKGSLENYFFEPLGGGTKVKVEVDSLKEYSDYFLSKWPDALKQLKRCCERRL
jgi:uncharacterized protein YndB with AHSA1/START domain